MFHCPIKEIWKYVLTDEFLLDWSSSINLVAFLWLSLCTERKNFFTVHTILFHLTKTKKKATITFMCYICQNDTIVLQ